MSCVNCLNCCFSWRSFVFLSSIKPLFFLFRSVCLPIRLALRMCFLSQSFRGSLAGGSMSHNQVFKSLSNAFQPQRTIRFVYRLPINRTSICFLLALDRYRYHVVFLCASIHRKNVHQPRCKYQIRAFYRLCIVLHTFYHRSRCIYLFLPCYYFNIKCRRIRSSQKVKDM